MSKRDTTNLRSVFSKDAVIQGIGHGSDKVTTFNVDEFLKAIISPHRQTWNLAITYNNITIGDNLAGVKIPYKLNWSKRLNNYGIAFIQLVKRKNDWKIIYLIDSGANNDYPIKN